MDLTRIVELLKLRPETLLGVLIGIGILVFLPESTLAWLGLLGFVTAFRGWLGGFFVLCAALILRKGLYEALHKVINLIVEFNLAPDRRDSFKYLSPPEKSLLASTTGQIQESTVLIWNFSTNPDVQG